VFLRIMTKPSILEGSYEEMDIYYFYNGRVLRGE